MDASERTLALNSRRMANVERLSVVKTYHPPVVVARAASDG